MSILLRCPPAPLLHTFSQQLLRTDLAKFSRNIKTIESDFELSTKSWNPSRHKVSQCVSNPSLKNICKLVVSKSSDCNYLRNTTLPKSAPQLYSIATINQYPYSSEHNIHLCSGISQWTIHVACHSTKSKALAKWRRAPSEQFQQHIASRYALATNLAPKHCPR